MSIGIDILARSGKFIVLPPHLRSGSANLFRERVCPEEFRLQKGLLASFAKRGSRYHMRRRAFVSKKSRKIKKIIIVLNQLEANFHNDTVKVNNDLGGKLSERK